MRRFLMLFGAAALVLIAAGTTYAVTNQPTLGTQIGSTVALGGTNIAVRAPVCPVGVSPADCTIVMTRATALESLTAGGGYPTSVKKNGVLVAFSVGLAQLSSNATTAKKFVKTLNTEYGGGAQAQITVLKRGTKNRWTVVAQGPLVKLQPYLGYVVQFPLATPIKVYAGEAIALTVPTWAPILSYNLAKTYYSYRQSREFNCNKPGVSQNAQMTVGQVAKYLCKYAGTRAEYDALELTTPVAPTTTKK